MSPHLTSGTPIAAVCIVVRDSIENTVAHAKDISWGTCTCTAVEFGQSSPMLGGQSRNKDTRNDCTHAQQHLSNFSELIEPVPRQVPGQDELLPRSTDALEHLTESCHVHVPRYKRRTWVMYLYRSVPLLRIASAVASCAAQACHFTA